MFNPPHPGLTLRDDVLPALGLTVTEAAQQLGVSRVALSPDVQLAIALLQERRIALISAAVTGQIDVRSAVRLL